MTIVHRVLPLEPVADLADHLRRRGAAGWEAARAVEPEVLIAEVLASGLRGRGGGGFPTGVKWRTVRDNRSTVESSSVVVNGAEGEPGTFKDRTIMRLNPFAVVEGALIAARAVGADQVIFGLKASFGPELVRVRQAIEEVQRAGWAEGVDLTVFEGPDEYLYGEETAMLETIDGRHPLPRVAPPYRQGVSEVDSDSGLPAGVGMAGPGTGTSAPPTLVNNVETLANVPDIIARGAAWFRQEGTEDSPGTIVCTVTGSTKRHGVGEVSMGTPLREVIDVIGGGLRSGGQVKAVLSGVANALVPAALLDTPLTYEAMNAIGSGLGSAGFIVFDDADDLTAVVAGVSRFLAVESCGQCTPCKQDGLALSGLLAQLSRSEAGADELEQVRSRALTVTDEARCYLATQQQLVVASLLDLFPEEVERHLRAEVGAVEPALIAELVDIEGDRAVIDEGHRDKQPDWTYDETDSGKSPAARLGGPQGPEVLPDS